MSRREEFKSRMKELKQYKDTTGKGYWEWKQSLPDNLKYTDESQYDLKGAYEAGLQPELNQEDGLYHLGSRDQKTGRILKRNIHPTYWKALEEDAKIGYDTYWIGNDTYTSRKGDAPIKAFALGGDNEENGENDDVFTQFTKQNPMQPGSVAPKDLAEQNRIQNLPYEQNEYQKQFAKAWYTQRAKYSKYDSQLGNGKLGRILETIDKSTYQTIPEFAETELKEYMRMNNIDKSLSPIEIELKSEQLQKKGAMGFARPSAYAWHVKPKTIKTPRVDYRGLGWHEGIGHIVGDNSTEIMEAAPKIQIKNQSGDKEYEKYINKQNEQHASTWEFRGANAEMLDDNGKRYIDPNRQLTPYDIRRMKEKGATIPVEWRDSNITESDIANFLNSFAYQDKPKDTFDFNTPNSTNEVFFGKNGGEIPSYEVGGTNEDRQTSIVTNTVKKALERGDIQLVQRILKRGNKEDRKFYYPDNGSIQSVLNIYDTPLLGDALSLLDALKYSVKGDWDNASLSYMDAVSPLALFSRSKLNWKGWGAKKKYIPEYEAIEKEAKKNGTWLKNADGTDFTGDPREWVVKRSKKFREAFGDKYLEGYTGIRSPYNPKELLDTYLSSRERAYTYTPNKQQVKKKGDTGIAKLVVPDTDTYTVDALGNDWLHLTDKSINPYNFTNTNQIVSSVQTPVISFKNIRDDGPFGIRDVAEDQFVAKSTTPRKSVLYNNGDFDLSNPDIFKATITPYIGYKLYNKANRENTQSYVIGGETGEIEVPDIYNTLTNEQKNRIVATGREYTQIDPFVQLTETGIHDYSNEINTYLDKDLLEFDAGYLPEVTIGPRSRFYIPLETYYPFISDYPYTGHSEIPYFVDWGGDDLGYNLVTNNCSDKTREALEYTFNKKINPFLFTTPGDVRDFAIEQLNGIKVPTGYDYDEESDKFVKIAKPRKGMDKVLIPASIEQYKKFKDYVLNSYQIGGETDSGNILGVEVPLWAETITSYIPVLGTAMDIKDAIQNPSLETISTAALSAASDLAGASIIRGLFKTTKGIDKLRKAEKALNKARKRHKLGKTQDYSEIIKASDELDVVKNQFGFEYGTDIADNVLSNFTKYTPIGLDFLVNTSQQSQKYK